MRVTRVSIASGVIFFMFCVGMKDATLEYFVPRNTFPTPTSAFGKPGEGADSGSYVMVKREGDLTKWIQTLNGVPVYGSVVTAKVDKSDKIIKVEGFAADPFSLVDPIPQISGSQASELLLQEWNHTDNTKFVVDIDEPTLYVISTDWIFDKLVWEVGYEVDYQKGVEPEDVFGPAPAYIVGLVNAHTGDIEDSWNNNVYTSVPVVLGNDKTGVSLTDIHVEQNQPSCWHVDETRRVRVINVMNNEYIPISEVEDSRFNCADADDKDWDGYGDTGAFSPRNDAFVHATQFVDLWNELIPNISIYRTENSYLNLLVHYGKGFRNAMFTTKRFRFGDGNDRYFPFTTLDMVCHELGHSVTAWNNGSRLEGRGEPGAIGESYADIVGETCDIKFNHKTNYLIGEDLTRSFTERRALRDMCTPTRQGGIDHYDQYTAYLRRFKRHIDVHHASGIYNKAWCHLVHTVGWDYEKAFKVFTKANLMFWKADMTMHCGVCGVESAADDEGLNRADVTEVFRVVGLSCSSCS